MIRVFDLVFADRTILWAGDSRFVTELRDMLSIRCTHHTCNLNVVTS